MNVKKQMGIIVAHIGVHELGIARAHLAHKIIHEDIDLIVINNPKNEAKPLHEIIEHERGLTITNTRVPELNIANEDLKKKAKKKIWHKGKCKNK